MDSYLKIFVLEEITSCFLFKITLLYLALLKTSLIVSTKFILGCICSNLNNYPSLGWFLVCYEHKNEKVSGVLNAVFEKFTKF